MELGAWIGFLLDKIAWVRWKLENRFLVAAMKLKWDSEGQRGLGSPTMIVCDCGMSNPCEQEVSPIVEVKGWTKVRHYGWRFITRNVEILASWFAINKGISEGEIDETSLMNEEIGEDSQDVLVVSREDEATRKSPLI